MMSNPKVTIAIPTRSRPDYLAVMLSCLASQSYRNWELILFPNGEDSGELSYLSKQLISILNVRKNKCSVVPMGELGRSPSVVYNRAQLLADELLLCLDDDLWLSHLYLEMMVEDFLSGEDKKKGPIVLSGVTPWSDNAFAEVGPDKVVDYLGDSGEKMISFCNAGVEGDATRWSLQLNQNARHLQCFSWVDTDVISPANFMMRPSVVVPWSDCAVPSLFADVIWGLQLTSLAGYTLGFTTRAEAWHLNAPSGGLRLEEGGYDKSGSRSVQWERVEKLLNESLFERFGNSR